MTGVALQHCHVVKPHLLVSGAREPTMRAAVLADLEADLRAQSQCSRTSTATCISYPRTLPSWQGCRRPSVSAIMMSSQDSGQTLSPPVESLRSAMLANDTDSTDFDHRYGRLKQISLALQLRSGLFEASVTLDSPLKTLQWY